MGNKQKLLEEFLNSGKIDIQRGAIFDRPPEPLPDSFDFDRIEGMLLGIAIGDSLGNTTEGMLPNERKRILGEIRDHLPNRYADGKPVGMPTDDTQLAFWTLERLIVDRGLIPENLAKRFSRDRIFGIGSSVTRFLTNYKSGIPWYESGPKSAGNGALMRIAPMLVPHLRSGTTDLWVDATLSAMITHNDSGSIAACLSFINILWELLKVDSAPDPQWWLETYVKTASDVEIDDSYSPRGGDYTNYRGKLCDFAEEYVQKSYDDGIPVIEACYRWYSGAYLLETVPSVIYILMCHANDPEEAVVRAVNDTKDNDTIGAIVGAAVGALYGKKGLPERWIENLSGRTSVDDDGRIFELIEESKKLWWA